MEEENGLITRRGLLKTAGACVAGIGAARFGLVPSPTDLLGSPRAFPSSRQKYFPPSEEGGGWRVGDPATLGVDVDLLNEALNFHDNSVVTTSHGGALVVVHKGHVIGERYVTGTEGGPQPWTPRTCNAVASSTKSVFGTAVGVFLEEYKHQVNLDSYLVGRSRDESLIPQIWDQPITDDRKKSIQVKHVLSMTSGHGGEEPWRATNPRVHYPGYSGSFQMYEYCFGWWFFDGIPSHHDLLFEPGNGFQYSNFGMEQFALAIRNISGQRLGPYVYDRVLGQIGMPIGIRDNQYRHVPEPNFSNDPGWGIGGSEGCDAYGTDGSESPYGYNSLAGASVRLNARDFARLGYLWLNKGRWGDQQLVPEEWMTQATRRFTRADGETPMNYGYTFWIQDDWESVPSDTFSSRGFKRNDCHVIPSLDLVVARLGNSNPPGRLGGEFTRTYIEKIVAAISRGD
jgi:CubicO group peptidase (beta-lactamase class C family)